MQKWFKIKIFNSVILSNSSLREKSQELKKKALDNFQYLFNREIFFSFFSFLA